MTVGKKKLSIEKFNELGKHLMVLGHVLREEIGMIRVFYADDSWKVVGRAGPDTLGAMTKRKTGP